MRKSLLLDHYIRMPSRYYKILGPVVVFGAAALLCVIVGYKTLQQPQSIAPVPIVSTTTSTSNAPNNSATSSLKTSPVVVEPVAPSTEAPIVSTTSETAPAVSIPANYLHATMSVAGVSYDLAFPPDSTLEAAMNLLESQNTSFSFTEQEYPGLGEFVDSINGKENAGGNYWFLYVNTAQSPTGITDTTLHSGDVIEWKYEHQ